MDKALKKTIIPQFFIVVMGLFLSSCSMHTGNFGMGNPMALSSSESLCSLQSYAGHLQKRMEVKQDGTEVEDLDPLKTNSYRRIEYIKGSKGKVAAAGPGGSLPGAPPEPSIPMDKEDIVKIFDDQTRDEPNGLLMDKVSTLEAYNAHKQRFHDLSKLYANANTPGMKLYKVLFTLWVEPERQHLMSYLYRWATPYGFRNYTKDYHADVMLSIKQPNGCNLNSDPKSCIKVVRVEPEHEGSISDEYYAAMNQSQLALSGAWQEIAGNVELAERLRQAQIEQRKYPILRSVIESPSVSSEPPNASKEEEKEADFHFIVSPRQHVEERTFRIPFMMSPYSINRRIESVPYNVAAYFLVPNKDQVTSLVIKATACWKKYGNPERDCEHNYVSEKHDAKKEGEDKSKNKELILNIDLPPDAKSSVTPEGCGSAVAESASTSGAKAATRENDGGSSAVMGGASADNQK